MPDVSRADERPWERTRVRAPAVDESLVAVPALCDAASLASGNHASLADADLPVQGKSLATVRSWARREALRVARDYTASLFAEESRHAERAGSASIAADATIFVSGHQPALFHPGVWVKNFVVDRLARQTGGIGLNLVVDNDALTTASVLVPRGTRDAPRVESVPFDAPRPVQPWEEARVVDRRLFNTFAARVGQSLSGWGYSPLLPDYWPVAVGACERGASLVESLTAARSQWEHGWGARNLELPVSRLCQTEPFLWLTVHLLAHLPRFHRIYNEVLREFRTAYRLRSRTHPVSDLRETEGWLEAPFWVWQAGGQARGRVFARQFSDELRLSDGRNVFASLPLTPARDACCAVEVLGRLTVQGLRLRTRALTTTLFARLCLADLFVHGLGGAKYDEMTDRLIARFFGIQAPGYLMLSGTLRLPLGAQSADRADELRLRRQIRQLDFHSEKHLPKAPGEEIAALIAEKQRLIARQQAVAARGSRGAQQSSPTPTAGYDRFRRLQEINRRLASCTVSERARLEQELSHTLRQLASNAILQNRDYAACLQPAQKLKRFIDHACSFIGP